MDPMGVCFWAKKFGWLDTYYFLVDLEEVWGNFRGIFLDVFKQQAEICCLVILFCTNHHLGEQFFSFFSSILGKSKQVISNRVLRDFGGSCDIDSEVNYKCWKDYIRV